MCLDSLAAIPLNGANPTEADLANKKGWYLGLNAGEQVVTSGITVYGTTTISTHVPADPAVGACTSTLGTARVYNINYRYAGTAACPISATGCNPTRSAIIDGGGLPPSAVAGQVKLDNGQIVPFCIGCEASSPLEGDQPIPPITTSQPKSLTYWFIQK
jgi:type IV pilus assembly protein PilY1